jgi:hypothetical protein
MNTCSTRECDKVIDEKQTVYLIPDGYHHSPHYKGMPICMECYIRIFVGKGEKPQLGGFKLGAYLNPRLDVLNGQVR